MTTREAREAVRAVDDHLADELSETLGDGEWALVGELVIKVRATTDAAWRERVREACEAEHRETNSGTNLYAVGFNAALAALAARLGLEETR